MKPAENIQSPVQEPVTVMRTPVRFRMISEPKENHRLVTPLGRPRF